MKNYLTYSKTISFPVEVGRMNDGDIVYLLSGLRDYASAPMNDVFAISMGLYFVVDFSM